MDRNGRPLAVVVGGVNIDIGGHSAAPLVAKDSNPGRVTVCPGGVGRNIAHNLCLLGVDTCLLTAMGDDLYANHIADSCEDLGIDVSHALRVPRGTTSTYLYLNDSDGDMALALSDMAICEKITPQYLQENRDLIGRADVIVIDTNIPAESIAWIAENSPVPVFADPVSTAKAEKLRPVLPKIHTLKPNLMEAELLTGLPAANDISLFHIGRALLDTGLQRAAVTLGSRGTLAADRSAIEIIPRCNAHVRNATGAGDAYMAALVWSWLQGRNFRDSCRIAGAAAALAIESQETVNPRLSPEAVLERLEKS